VTGIAEKVPGPRPFSCTTGKYEDSCASSLYGQVLFVVVAEEQVDKKPEATVTGAKIALVGAIAAAMIGATATITVALLQRKDPVPAPATLAPTFPAGTPGFAERKVFDEYALEGDRGVKKVLIGSYGMPADQIQSVDCPADQEVRVGNKFTCTVQLDGGNPRERVVDITVRSDNGEYEVGTPRDK
jgi:hypothetical protein